MNGIALVSHAEAIHDVSQFTAVRALRACVRLVFLEKERKKEDFFKKIAYIICTTQKNAYFAPFAQKIGKEV